MRRTHDAPAQSAVLPLGGRLHDKELHLGAGDTSADHDPGGG